MSNKKRKILKLKGSLRSCYLQQRGFFVIFFEDFNGKTHHAELHYPFFKFLDFDGSKMKKNIENLANELSQYHINAEDIENAVVEACEKAKIRAPKHLR